MGNYDSRRTSMALAFATLMISAGATTVAQTPASTDQAGPTPPQQPVASDQANEIEEIVVVGIRASLDSSTKAKRSSISFGDSIFAEDIGKLPASNLAETLERVPGVRLSREASGEGVNVAIRGLGSNFTKVLLNNTQIGVASDGSGFTRAVDLDLMPSELFTRIDVQKSATASQLEGGTSGVVDLRNARAFDNPGSHLNLVAQGAYGTSSESVGERAAIVASTTTEKFGVLFGVAGLMQDIRTDGYDTVGYSDGTVAGCTVALGCETAGLSNSNNFVYAPVAPANIGHGLTTGDPVDLAATSGLSQAQIAAARIPRLGRPNYIFGERTRWNALLALEYRPTDELQFSLDLLNSYSQRDSRNVSPNWYVRNSGPGPATNPAATGGMVPFDVTLDENNFVQTGTFANSAFFVADTKTKTTTKFYNINPGMNWQPTHKVRLDAQVNYSHSTFYREQPAFNFLTPYQSGLEVYYDNTKGNPQPLLTTNRDLNDLNLGWRWYRVSLQDVARDATTKGAHVDLTLGDDDNNLKIGVAYDDIYAGLRAHDNTAAFQTFVCGATCEGTTGAVPNSALQQYILPSPISNYGHLADNVGIDSFVYADYRALENATNYREFLASAPEVRGAVTGGSTGNVGERTAGTYVQTNGLAQILDRDLRFNAGIRFFHTTGTVSGPIQVGTTLQTLTDERSYDDVLPSFNMTYDVATDVKLRLAGSRTITRADLGLLLPGLTFSDPSAQQANAGNPDLKPYTSTNLDIGGEWYTGGIGYVGVGYFRKNIDGFTTTQSATVPFTALGIDFSTLNSTQQAAMNLRGGPTVATVTLSRPVNLQSLLLSGIELNWVQPLDFLVEGLGFGANATHISQKSSSGLYATGVAPYSVNLHGFYEAHGVSLSVNYVWTDKFRVANPPQNGLSDVSIYADERGELDLSFGYQLPVWDKRLRLTLDALNITEEPLRQTFGYDNNTNQVFYPGAQYLLGVRASF